MGPKEVPDTKINWLTDHQPPDKPYSTTSSSVESREDCRKGKQLVVKQSQPVKTWAWSNWCPVVNWKCESWQQCSAYCIYDRQNRMPCSELKVWELAIVLRLLHLRSQSVHYIRLPIRTPSMVTHTRDNMKSKTISMSSHILTSLGQHRMCQIALVQYVNHCHNLSKNHCHLMGIT
jgi:hypothetical protein